MFWQITLPLSRPILATVGVLALIGSWNDLKLYQTEQECGDGKNDWRKDTVEVMEEIGALHSQSPEFKTLRGVFPNSQLLERCRDRLQILVWCHSVGFRKLACCV
jgi:hypothetical protein